MCKVVFGKIREKILQKICSFSPSKFLKNSPPRGVYFLVERLKVYVYRRLFRRVAAIYSTLVANETEATRVPLQVGSDARSTVFGSANVFA